MKWPREKMIAYGSGAVGSLLLLAVLVHLLVLGPLREMEATRRDRQQRINELEVEQRAQQAAGRRLERIALLRLGDDDKRVRESVRVRLDQLLQQSGLGNERLSLTPMSGTRVAGVFQEVGWVVRARGSLENITDFFYLLEQQPFLLRVDEVGISPVSRSTELDLEVRCSTIVLDMPNADRIERQEFEDAGLEVALDSPQRRRFAAITQRDLFRPYIPREPTPRERVVERPSEPPRQPRSTPNPDAALARLQVVSLTTWNGEPEILIRDTQSGQSTSYAVGDALAGGTIASVDYRALPSMENEALVTYSRVIVESEGGFWAVDLGRTLNQRRVLDESTLPPALKTTLTSAQEEEEASPR